MRRVVFALASVFATTLATMLPLGRPGGAAAEPAAPAVSLAVERYVLANGLEVILSEDHRTPVVAVNIRYHVGSKDEPAGRNGFAHLFEHLMYRGSKHVAPGAYAQYIEHAGGDANAQTGFDWTRYYEILPSNELALALWLESDRMASLVDGLTQATFATEREVVQNERRQNWENAPYGLVSPIIAEALYPKGHPYRTFPIGTAADLDAASVDDVQRFFKTFYVPNNATLVIAGDVDPAQARELVAKYFASIPRGAPPPIVTAPVEVKLTRESRLDIEADVELARLYVKWPTPPWYTPGEAELDLAALVLGWGTSSRLYKRLVHDRGIAEDVVAAEDSQLLGSRFLVQITLKKGQSPMAALALVDEEIGKLEQEGPTAAELERAKARLLTDKVFDAERVNSRADLLNRFAQYVHDPSYFAEHLARHQRPTAEDVKRAVARWLPRGARVVAVVTPTPGAPRSGRLKVAP